MLMIKNLFLVCSIVVCYCDAYEFDVGDALATFKACDVNNDNGLVFEEYSKFLRQGGTKHTAVPRNVEDAEYYATFNLMDVNGDKKLDQREFILAYTLFSEFKSYDTNHDILLDENELVEIFNFPNGPGGDGIAYVEFLARIINEVKHSFQS